MAPATPHMVRRIIAENKENRTLLVEWDLSWIPYTALRRDNTNLIQQKRKCYKEWVDFFEEEEYRKCDDRIKNIPHQPRFETFTDPFGQDIRMKTENKDIIREWAETTMQEQSMIKSQLERMCIQEALVTDEEERLELRLFVKEREKEEENMKRKAANDAHERARAIGEVDSQETIGYSDDEDIPEL